MRVGLQKISQSRGLHKELRLQVEQHEVELPSIEGLIFINIPRCSGRAPRAQRPRSLGSGLRCWPPADSGPCAACTLTCVPLLLGTAGVQGLTCGVLTATQGLRSHAWTTGCWRWWG